jgi:hypothetical protein
LFWQASREIIGYDVYACESVASYVGRMAPVRYFLLRERNAKRDRRIAPSRQRIDLCCETAHSCELACFTPATNQRIISRGSQGTAQAHSPCPQRTSTGQQQDSRVDYC